MTLASPSLPASRSSQVSVPRNRRWWVRSVGSHRRPHPYREITHGVTASHPWSVDVLVMTFFGCRCGVSVSSSLSSFVFIVGVSDLRRAVGRSCRPRTLTTTYPHRYPVHWVDHLAVRNHPRVEIRVG